MTTVLDAPQIELRPYQVEALQKTAQAEAENNRRQLGVAATGLGKTVMFVSLARQRGCRTLILVHRDELVRQAVEKVQEIWPDVDVGVVKAERNEINAHVVVASVQTLSREKRLTQLLDTTRPVEFDGVIWGGGVQPAPFGLVVVDEAHHAAAATYRRVLEALHVGEEGGPLLLGVTATPDRGDGKGLDDLFEGIVWNYDILWGIRAGYLSDVRGLMVTVADLDLSQVKIKGGDYDQTEVGRKMEESSTPDTIFHAWAKHAANRRTLIFTPTVAVAHAVAGVFSSKGVSAAAIDATTPLEERREILRRYSRGDIQVLANCGVLTEGYDEPRTDCIIMARPTRSRALFTQCIGRGTRRHPDKLDCLVLDIVGSTLEHSLVTIPSLFGMTPKFAGGLQDGSVLVSVQAQAQDDHMVEMGKMKAEQANLFRALRKDGIHWVQRHRGAEQARYERSLATRDSVSGERIVLPTVVLYHSDITTEHGWLCGIIEPNGKKRVLIRDVGLEMAQGVGEDFIRKTMGPNGGLQLIDTNARWRKKKPTEGQLRAATKWKMLNPERYRTAGELSDALDAHISRTKEQQQARRR